MHIFLKINSFVFTRRFIQNLFFDQSRFVLISICVFFESWCDRVWSRLKPIIEGSASNKLRKFFKKLLRKFEASNHENNFLGMFRNDILKAFELGSNLDLTRRNNKLKFVLFRVVEPSMFKALTVTNLSNNKRKFCCTRRAEEKQMKNLVADWKSCVEDFEVTSSCWTTYCYLQQ